MSQENNEQYSREEMERMAEKLLEKTNIITLASVTEDGFPRPCTVVKVTANGIQKIYIATGTSSKKTAHFRVQPKGGLSFFGEHDGATLIGTVRILPDGEKEHYWQDWMLDHFPQGKADPEFCVLEFTTSEAILWIRGQFETYRY